MKSNLPLIIHLINSLRMSKKKTNKKKTCELSFKSIKLSFYFHFLNFDRMSFYFKDFPLVKTTTTVDFYENQDIGWIVLNHKDKKENIFDSHFLNDFHIVYLYRPTIVFNISLLFLYIP